MKRFAAVFCVFLFVCSALFLQVSAESNASKIDIYCTVNSDGDCLISMTVNLHLESGTADLTFPLPYGAEKITMNGSSVPTTRSGSRTLVSVSKVTGGMTGDFPVRFDFTLKGAVGVTPEKKLELMLPMLSGFEFPVQAFSFIVTLPDNITSVPLFTSTYQQVGFEANLELAVSGNMITGSSINSLNDHESVSMTLAVPREMFPSISVYQRTGNPELIPMGIFLGLALIFWLIFLRTLPPHRTRTTVPPEGICAGELGCRLTMAGGDLSMIVLSWAQMGYLIIQPDGSQIHLYKQMEMGNERSLFEIRVFNTLFKNRTHVNCCRPGYAALCRKTAGMVPGEKAMCRPGYGNRLPFRLLLSVCHIFCGICVAMNMTSIPVLQVLFSFIFGAFGYFSAMEMHNFAFCLFTRNRFHVWTSLGLTAAWFLLGLIAGQPWIPLGASVVQILMGFLYAFGGRRTELNRNDAGEILALRRYLRAIPREEAARLLKADPEYFYRMAPYAIALGVGKPFADAFGRRPLESCPYIIRNSEGKTAAQWMRMMTGMVSIMDSRYHRMQLEKWMAIRVEKKVRKRPF